MSAPRISIPGASPLSMPQHSSQQSPQPGLHATVLVLTSAEGISLLADSSDVVASAVIRVPGQHWNADI